jgi:putative tricarboxylic transport membrane protein
MLTAIVIGSLLGTIAGLLPGVGVFTALLISLPFLIGMDPVNILILYVAIASVSQFVGSIPAIMLGIPGEYSSMPAVIESKNIASAEEKSSAIVQTAIGSAFGSLFVLCLTLLALPHIVGVFGFYLTNVQLFLYLLITLIICWASGNRWWVSAILFLIGSILGAVGYSVIFKTNILVFDQPQLISGLPAVVVISVLFALPQLWQSVDTLRRLRSAPALKLPFQFPNLVWSGFYSIVGFVGGLVPGMTTILSSQAAYNISKWFKQNATERVVAAEVANNAGAFSQLLPMLLLGIPILSSEALLLGIVESRGLTFTLANFADHMNTIAVALVFINIIGLILAWPLSTHLTKIYKFDFRLIIALILTAIVGGVIISAVQTSSVIFYSLTALALLPLAWLIRNLNTTPLVFGFLIYPLLIENLYRFLILQNFISL